MDRSAHIDIVGLYVDLETLLARLRELRNRCMQVADVEGRDDLWTACQLVERTRARLLLVIEHGK